MHLKSADKILSDLLQTKNAKSMSSFKMPISSATIFPLYPK